MNKFKNGDRVSITRTSLEGVCGVVTEVFGESYDPQYKVYVEDMNQSTLRYQSELEMIDENGNVINTIVESGENNRIYFEDAVDGMNIFICIDDGEVPHVHYEKTREDGTLVEGCICLQYPLFYKETFHNEKLTRDEFNSIIEFFHEEYVWDYIKERWNSNNKVQLESEVIPDYYYGMMTTYEGDPMLEKCEEYFK